MTQYSYSTDGERYTGSFDTREEAAAEGTDCEGQDWCWVGENVDPTQPENYWDAFDWLEHVSSQDDYRGEHAESWDRSTREQQAELTGLVRAVLSDWLDRHGLRPKFWNVVNECTVSRDGEVLGRDR